MLFFHILLLRLSFGRLYVFLILLQKDRCFRGWCLTGIGHVADKTCGKVVATRAVATINFLLIQFSPFKSSSVKLFSMEAIIGRFC